MTKRKRKSLNESDQETNRGKNQDQGRISSVSEYPNDCIFMSEICAMMHAFGDVKEPKQESVLLVHRILRDQMNFLLLEAADTTLFIRGGKEITHEDLLFLMRKNKMKIKRLLEYLQVLDLSLHGEFKHIEGGGSIPVSSKKGKRVDTCLKFLVAIEDCEDFTSVMKDKTALDRTAKKRMLRRHWMTHFMNINEYKEFSEKFAPASFCPMQKAEKFKKWLLQDQQYLDLTGLAVTIMDFLARETIAEIVDMALLIQAKKSRKSQHDCVTQFPHNQPLLNFEKSSSCTFKNIITEDKVDDKDHLTSTSPNKILLNPESDSINQVTVNKGNFTPFTDDTNREENITDSKMDEDSNVPDPHQTEFPSIQSPYLSQSPSSPLCQVGEDRVRSRKTSGSESNLEIRSDLSGECYQTIDDSEVPCNTYLNEASNGATPNSASNEFEISFEENQNRNRLKKLKSENFEPLTDISDEEDILNIPDKSNEKLLKLTSELSNNSQNSCLAFGSEGTLQGTPNAGTSVHSQGTNSGGNTFKYDLEELSNTPDFEYFPDKITSSCRNQKSSKQPTSPKYNENLSQETETEQNLSVDISTTDNLSMAALHEVSVRTAITPLEITEAFSRFQEPSPMVLFFCSDEIPRRTKLICLREALSFELV